MEMSKRVNRQGCFIGIILTAMMVSAVAADNAIGCKYQSSLCEVVEVCVDDAVFGQCQTEPFDVHQYKLNQAEEELLRLELTRLALEGEDWSSSSVQCVLRYFFLTHRYGLSYDQNFCNIRNPDSVIGLLEAAEMTLKERANDDAQDDLNWLDSDDDEDGSFDVPGDGQWIPDTKNNGEFIVATRRVPEMADESESSENYIPEQASVDTQDEDEQFFMTPQEEQLLNEYVVQTMRGERPDFSSLSWDQVKKFNAYVDLLEAAVKERMRATTGEVVSDDEVQGTADLERFLYKKDEERLGILDQGIADKEHRIHKGDPQRVQPTPAPTLITDGKWIQGDRIYIKLTTNITDEEIVKALMEYLEEKVGEPNNVTFSDVRVQNNELSFRVDSLNGLTPDWLSDAIELPPANLMNTAEVAKETFQLLKKEKFVAEVGLAAAKRSNDVALERAEPDDGFVVPTLIVCGLVVGSLVVVLGVYVYRSRNRAKATLERLAADLEGPPGKDYEELCRQRMSAKTEGPEPLSGIVGTLAQRLGSQGEPSPPAATYVHSTHSSTSSWSEEPVQTNMDISTGHMILSYMEDHLLNKDRLEQEWKELEAYQPDITAAIAANNIQNQTKNRSQDAVPYDHNRVVLKESGNQNSSDYINASFIFDHDPRSPAYIATQAPLAETVADFWQMVWEQGSVVIVNLTKLIEGGDTKCHRYWPENGSELHHIYEVHLVSEHIWCEDYLVRSFYLKNLRTQETRTVTQFHFLTWSEDSIPSSSKALLEFRRKVNKSYRGRSCPIVVHCSDGGGRTGTYCLLDMVLNRINKGVKEIDIAAALEHLRDQRMKSIRTMEQFEFVLASVAEEVQAVLKALPQ